MRILLLGEAPARLALKPRAPQGPEEMAAATTAQRRPGAELGPVGAKRRQRLPLGRSALGHGRHRARLLTRLQEAAGHAAAEAQAAAEERARRPPALRRGPEGPLRARPPQPLLQSGQRAAAAGPAASGGTGTAGGGPASAAPFWQVESRARPRRGKGR